MASRSRVVSSSCDFSRCSSPFNLPTRSFSASNNRRRNSIWRCRCSTCCSSCVISVRLRRQAFSTSMWHTMFAARIVRSSAEPATSPCSDSEDGVASVHDPPLPPFVKISLDLSVTSSRRLTLEPLSDLYDIFPD